MRINVAITLLVIMLTSITSMAATPAAYTASHETFTVDFYVQDVDDMFTWQIGFRFNLRELEFVEFTAGQNGYFLHDFASEYNHTTWKVGRVVNGTGLIAETVLGWFDVQASGSGKLCSLTFRTLGLTSEPTITLLIEDTIYLTREGRTESIVKPLVLRTDACRIVEVNESFFDDQVS